jgi:hypothetical protein
MHLTGTIFLFWTTGLLGHCLLSLVLVIRGRVRMFPIFTALIACNIVKTVVLYAIARDSPKHTYLVAYFGFAILDFVLQLSVTFELSRHLFCPTGTWAQDVRRGIMLLATVSLLIAFVLASLPVPPEGTVLGTLLDRGNLLSSALQCELFVGMIAFSTIARLPWKTHVARIAQGLGVYELIGILTEAGHNLTVRNSLSFQALTYVRMSAYLACVTYWIVMLWRDAPEPMELPEDMRRLLFTMQINVDYDLRKLRAFKK